MNSCPDWAGQRESPAELLLLLPLPHPGEAPEALWGRQGDEELTHPTEGTDLALGMVSPQLDHP